MDRRRFLKLSGLALGSVAAAPLLGRLGGLESVAAASDGKTKKQVTVGLDPKLPVHASLQYGAIAEPDKKVLVIVQTKTKADNHDEIAKHGDAKHLESFAFIKSHHMEVKQKDVLKLATHKDVFYISPDSEVHKHQISPDKLVTSYAKQIEAGDVWKNKDHGATGRGVGIAVLDTGVNHQHPDLKGQHLNIVNVNKKALGTGDSHGHGTHVIGTIIGQSADGAYIGVAPNASVHSIKIADDQGMAQESDLLRGLSWVHDNYASKNIRVVNISVTAGTPTTYRTSPSCAAVEELWKHGVVVVVAAGNHGSDADAMWYAPANDPYVLTVGAVDDQGNDHPDHDTLASYSSRGKTQDGVIKPEIVAPGRRIYSTLASTGCTLATQYPAQVAADQLHMRLSGTSMAAPIVVGSVALILERYPNLTPNQVKWIVMNAAQRYGGDGGGGVGDHQQPLAGVKAGLIDPKKMLDYLDKGDPIGAPMGIPLAQLIPGAAAGKDTTTSAYWDSAYWDSAYWDSAYWDSAYWDSAYWDSAYWDSGTNTD